MPLTPWVTPAPSIDRPRSTTLAVFGVAEALSLMMMPLTPELRTLPKVPVQSRVIDLVMVTVPKPPGSRQLISPPVAVFEIAPAKVLHGAVRLHGLTSSPTPETQVRVACAAAGAAEKMPKTAVARASAGKCLRIEIMLLSRTRVFCAEQAVSRGGRRQKAHSRRTAMDRRLVARCQPWQRNYLSIIACVDTQALAAPMPILARNRGPAYRVGIGRDDQL